MGPAPTNGREFSGSIDHLSFASSVRCQYEAFWERTVTDDETWILYKNESIGNAEFLAAK